MKRMMMKRIFLTMLIGASALNAYSQDISTLFRQMPDQYIPQLENAWRKDLTDLYAEGKEARLKNNMNGSCVLEKMNKDYLRIKSTESTRIEMRRLPLINDTYIICMVTTLFGPVADSRVEFYSTDWKPIDASGLLKFAKREDFFREDKDTTSIAWQEISGVMDMDLIEYRLDEDKPLLTATYTTPQYLSEEMQKKIKPFMNEKPKTYIWKKSGFVEN